MEDDKDDEDGVVANDVVDFDIVDAAAAASVKRESSLNGTLASTDHHLSAMLERLVPVVETPWPAASFELLPAARVGL